VSTAPANAASDGASTAFRAEPPASYAYSAVVSELSAPGVALAVCPAGACSLQPPVEGQAPAPASLRDLHSDSKHTLVVAEDTVRSMVAVGCLVTVTVATARCALNADFSGLSGEEERLATTDITMDIANMLVGDTSAVLRLGGAVRQVPEALSVIFSSIEISLECVAHEPPAMPGGTSALVATAREGPANPAAPVPFLPPGLQTGLLPIVLRLQEARDLPNHPATRWHLDTCCHPCSVRIHFPGLQSPLCEHASSAATPWRDAEPREPLDQLCAQPLATRSLPLGAPHVVLAADLDMPAFIETIRTEPMVIEVHDRTADPEEVPLATLASHVTPSAAVANPEPGQGASGSLKQKASGGTQAQVSCMHCVGAQTSRRPLPQTRMHMAQPGAEPFCAVMCLDAILARGQEVACDPQCAPPHFARDPTVAPHR
jgi:hypothetical protein